MNPWVSWGIALAVIFGPLLARAAWAIRSRRRAVRPCAACGKPLAAGGPVVRAQDGSVAHLTCKLRAR